MVRSYELGRSLWWRGISCLILPGSGFMHARQRAEDLRLALEAACVLEGNTPSPDGELRRGLGFPCQPRRADSRGRRGALSRQEERRTNCIVSTVLDARKISRAPADNRPLRYGNGSEPLRGQLLYLPCRQGESLPRARARFAAPAPGLRRYARSGLEKAEPKEILSVGNA